MPTLTGVREAPPLLAIAIATPAGAPGRRDAHMQAVQAGRQAVQAAYSAGGGQAAGGRQTATPPLPLGTAYLPTSHRASGLGPCWYRRWP